MFLKGRTSPSFLSAKRAVWFFGLFIIFGAPSTNIPQQSAVSQINPIIEFALTDLYLKLPASKKIQRKLTTTKDSKYLKGHLELSTTLGEKIPFGSLEVMQLVGGEVRAKATVSRRDYSFELPLIAAKAQGYIRAEVKDIKGKVIGVGEHSISHLRRAGFSISVFPVHVGAKAQVLSARSFSKFRYQVKGAEVSLADTGLSFTKTKDGQFVIRDLSPDSSYIALAEAQNHWPTVTVGVSEAMTSLRLFSEVYMRRQLHHFNFRENPPVIWGRVVDARGVPQKGVRVEIAGLNVSASYPNSLHIIDKKLKSTSDRGFFVFIGVPEGLQAVRLKKQNAAAELIPTEAGVVSYVELQTEQSQQTLVTAFNPWDGQDKNFQARTYGSSVFKALAKQHILKWNAQKGLVFIESQAPSYLSTLYTCLKDSKELALPLISESWLKKIIKHNKPTPLFPRPQGSLIVGFTSGALREVGVLGGITTKDSYRVYYFNSQGKLIQNGQAAAGFVIDGAPLGLVTVTGQNSTQGLHTQLVAVDYKGPSVLVLGL